MDITRPFIKMVRPIGGIMDKRYWNRDKPTIDQVGKFYTQEDLLYWLPRLEPIEDEL